MKLYISMIALTLIIPIYSSYIIIVSDLEQYAELAALSRIARADNATLEAWLAGREPMFPSEFHAQKRLQILEEQARALRNLPIQIPPKSSWKMNPEEQHRKRSPNTKNFEDMIQNKAEASQGPVTRKSTCVRKDKRLSLLLHSHVR